MSNSPLQEMVLWFRDAHTNILQLAESLSEEQLRWQPHPLANSIGFQLWHLARGADYVQARLSDATTELSRRLGVREQIWLVEAISKMVNCGSNPERRRANGPHRGTMGNHQAAHSRTTETTRWSGQTPA